MHYYWTSLHKLKGSCPKQPSSSSKIVIIVLAHTGFLIKFQAVLWGRTGQNLFFAFFWYCYIKKNQIIFGFCINIKPQYVDCTAMAYYDQVRNLSFPKKRTFQQIHESTAIHLPCILRKSHLLQKYCNYQYLLIWAAISSHKWNQFLEMVFSKGKFWKYPKWCHRNNYCKLWKAINQMWFPLTTSGMNLFLICLFFFSFIPPSIMSSILHPLDHKSSLLICCFFIHKMLFSFVPTSTTLHTMFTMFNQSATIFIHG